MGNSTKSNGWTSSLLPPVVAVCVGVGYLAGSRLSATPDFKYCPIQANSTCPTCFGGYFAPNISGYCSKAVPAELRACTPGGENLRANTVRCYGHSVDTADCDGMIDVTMSCYTLRG